MSDCQFQTHSCFEYREKWDTEQDIKQYAPLIQVKGKPRSTVSQAVFIVPSYLRSIAMNISLRVNDFSLCETANKVNQRHIKQYF